MKLILITYYNLIEFLRQPAYCVTTLLFPSMFFWFFGVPNAKDQSSALLLTTSFALFGCLTVMLFQMAVQIAQEREISWSWYQRTLPVRPLDFLLGKVCASLVLSLLAILAVLVVAKLTTPINYSDVTVAKLVFFILLGSVPFAFLGITIGYVVRGNAAIPLANLVHLPLSFAGGLWVPPSALPVAIQNISEYLPTRVYGEIMWAIAFDKELAARNIHFLIIYGVFFLRRLLSCIKKTKA